MPANIDTCKQAIDEVIQMFVRLATIEEKLEQLLKVQLLLKQGTSLIHDQPKNAEYLLELYQVNLQMEVDEIVIATQELREVAAPKVREIIHQLRQGDRKVLKHQKEPAAIC